MSEYSSRPQGHQRQHYVLLGIIPTISQVIKHYPIQWKLQKGYPSGIVISCISFAKMIQCEFRIGKLIRFIDMRILIHCCGNDLALTTPSHYLNQI